MSNLITNEKGLEVQKKVNDMINNMWIKIDEERTKQNLSFRELSRLSNYPSTTLSECIITARKGETARDVNCRAVYRIANALRLPVDYLLYGKETKEFKFRDRYTVSLLLKTIINSNGTWTEKLLQIQEILSESQKEAVRQHITNLLINKK